MRGLCKDKNTLVKVRERGRKGTSGYTPMRWHGNGYDGMTAVEEMSRHRAAEAAEAAEGRDGREGRLEEQASECEKSSTDKRALTDGDQIQVRAKQPIKARTKNEERRTD